MSKLIAKSNELDTTSSFATLQMAFNQQLPEKIAEIERLWLAFSQDQSKSIYLEDLYRLVNHLVGDGSHYGSVSINDNIRKLDRALKLILSEHNPNHAISGVHSQVPEFLSALRTAADNLQSSKIAYAKYDKSSAQRESNLIFLLEPDDDVASSLIPTLETSHYRVQRFLEISDIETAFDNEVPAAIIVDLVLEDGQMIDEETIISLKNSQQAFPPVIIISEGDNIQVRLAAARAGALRYFGKPLDFNKLIHTLDALTKQKATIPYRVLLIDDDKASLNLYALVLRKAGMEIEILSDPLDCLEVLSKFNPDILVLDVYMPGCSGPELAQVIRQDDTWALMPIMFLSAESNLNRRLEAMILGGDDFLSKPVEPDLLVASVVARAKQARVTNRLYKDLVSTLRENETHLATMSQHDIVSTTDIDGKITGVNDNFCDISGYSRTELICQNHRILKSNQHSHEFFQQMWDVISKGEIWHGTVCNLNKSGEEFWAETTIVPFLNDAGRPYKYISARTDITVRKQIEKKLVQSKERAESANQAKSQFLSSMSHELRTPMNAILGFSQLLKVDNTHPLVEEQRQNVDEIIQAGKHLLKLINEVLDLSKIEAGRIDLSIECISPIEVLSEALQLILPLVQRRGIEIKLQFNDKDIALEKLLAHGFTIQADRMRFKQVLLNLLSNAVKYNCEDGSIVIACKQLLDKKQLRISITDTGAGLSEQQQSQLFVAFNRLGAEQTEIEGAGIGLVITENIIKLMRGNIGVVSTLGEGCTFWIELPSEETTDQRPNGTQTTATTIQSPNELNQDDRVVLYVEDNPANLRLVTQLLGRLPNIQVWSAPEPFLGLELAAEHKPDLILLDINLPGMDGFELLKELRLRQATRDTPIIAISANAMPKDIEKGMQAGFNDYITKPINVERLLETVNSRLNNIKK